MTRLTPALMRGLDILELFLDREEGLSAPEITAATGLPRATVHELLVTLVTRSYLSKDERTGQFQLGLRAFQLGNAYGERLDLVATGRAVAQEIAASCDETVNIGTLDGSSVVYLAKVESSHAVRMVSAVGRRVSASCTALGKVLLADLSPQAVEGLYLEGCLPRLTPRSIASMKDLLAQLEQVRRTGQAFESGESTAGVTCVAAPVRDHRGDVIAALSVSVPDMRWEQRHPEEWADFAREGAQRMSELLGARRPGNLPAQGRSGRPVLDSVGRHS
jgi:IclR family transcriptional regulator, KDG regulon repressor